MTCEGTTTSAVTWHLFLLLVYIRTSQDVCFTAWKLVNIQILATSPAVKQIGLTWWKMFPSGWQLDLSPQARKSMTRRVLCTVKRTSWSLTRSFRRTVWYIKQIPSCHVLFFFLWYFTNRFPSTSCVIGKDNQFFVEGCTELRWDGLTKWKAQ